MSLTQNPAGAPLFVEYKTGTRRRIAAAVDALVALLDEIDSDADFEEDDTLEDDAPLEDGGDAEPSLGAPGASSFPPQILWSQGASDDGEEEHDGREPDEDGEPALGATTALNQECAWAAPRGWPEDGEAEPSHGWAHARGHPEIALRGYDDDREPSIGGDDLELDHAEQSGCGDMDGVKEQHGFGVEWAG